jgi:hypothetical protein
MAGRGPAPKPAHLRQRTNRKPGAAQLETPSGKVDVPELPNPDQREWHPMTVAFWKAIWASAMAAEWLPSDMYGLGRLVVLCDDFNKEPTAKLSAEIRMLQKDFGLTPLDRSRLSWEVQRGEEAERKRPRPEVKKTGTNDPRAFLTAVK